MTARIKPNTTADQIQMGLIRLRLYIQHDPRKVRCAMCNHRCPGEVCRHCGAYIVYEFSYPKIGVSLGTYEYMIHRNECAFEFTTAIGSVVKSGILVGEDLHKLLCLK